MEVVFDLPDLNSLREFVFTGIDKLVEELDLWDEDDQRALAEGLELINREDEEMSDILRIISAIINKNARSLEVKNLVDILQLLADIIDFADEALGYMIEALIGMEEDID